MNSKSEDDPDAFYRDVLNVAEQVGAKVVDGLVRGMESEAFPSVILSTDAISSVISFAKPKLIYLSKLEFDVVACPWF
jgi:hypothetical protein